MIYIEKGMQLVFPMKTRLVVTIVMGCAQMARAQAPEDYHKDGQGLRGKVKSLVETRYGVSQGGVGEEKVRKIAQDTYTYNEAGYLLEAIHAGPSETLWRDFHVYDSRGNRTEAGRYNGQGELIWKNTYKYDQSGLEVEKGAFDHRGKPTFTIYSSYNARGEVLTIKKAASTGKARTIAENIYDANGRLIEERLNDLTGPVNILNTYDEAGNKVESALYDSKKRLEEKQTFRYDADGRLIENVVYTSPDFSGRKILFAYDDKGNLVSRSRYGPDGQLLEKDAFAFEYDDSGYLIKEGHARFYAGMAEANETTAYASFDAMGNWLRKSEAKNGIAQYLTERQIQYFDRD